MKRVSQLEKRSGILKALAALSKVKATLIQRLKDVAEIDLY